MHGPPNSARAVGARAYAVGQHAVFAAGSYAPHTKSGRRLLAHELAHVVQQEGASAGGVPALAGLRWEPEADAAADAVLSGRNASVIGRTTQPLLAKFSERKTMTDPDGAEVQVDRIINPGKCVSKPETRTSSKKDVTGEQAFLELDFCKGRTGASARGEVNYGEAIDKARTAASNLAQNLASQRPDQALQTFRDELGQISPNAKVETSFQVPGARVGATATGAASGAEGASGQAVVTGAVDFKSLTFPRRLCQVNIRSRRGGGPASPRHSRNQGSRQTGSPTASSASVADAEVLFQCHKPPGKSRASPGSAHADDRSAVLQVPDDRSTPRFDRPYRRASSKLAVQRVRAAAPSPASRALLGRGALSGRRGRGGSRRRRSRSGGSRRGAPRPAGGDQRRRVRGSECGRLGLLGDALVASYPGRGKRRALRPWRPRRGSFGASNEGPPREGT